jgi:LCP family protein required for cell wall assembly
MKRFPVLSNLPTVGNARLLQLVGLAVILTGLGGFWLSQDGSRLRLSDGQRATFGLEKGDFQASFVVAGRDIFYSADGGAEPKYGVDGEIIAWEYQGLTDANGTNTDTILFVQIINNEITLVPIPRDIYLDDWENRINAMYYSEGAEGLKRSVAELLGWPIEYYVVINIDIFANLVNAMGGVEVNIPYRMQYVDNAAGLYIDFEPGATKLDGEAASKFVRYRNTLRGDLDRLDNVKGLAVAMVAKIKELNIRTVSLVPQLLRTLVEDVETNAGPGLLRQLIPRIGNFEIRTATLPIFEVDGETYLSYDRFAIERFLAETFQGTERHFTTTPDATLLITNSSGAEGLAEWYRDQLRSLGVPKSRVITRVGPFDPSPTRLLVTDSYWQSADFYTDLLHAPRHQVDRLPIVDRKVVDIELVLGRDAARLHAHSIVPIKTPLEPPVRSRFD